MQHSFFSSAPELQTLPRSFVERLDLIVPQSFRQSVLEGLTAPRLVTFRVNPLRPGGAEAVDALRQEVDVAPVPWCLGAYSIHYDDRPRLLSNPGIADGCLYVQSASSLVPAIVLDPRPGERVLDLAAAPGSKTTQIAAMMENEGELAAVDNVRNRFFRLKANLERAGVTNARTLLRDGGTAWQHRPDYFDRVLIDAPCSSEGRITTLEPQSHRYWRPLKIKEMQGKQRRLLSSAVRCAREGGVIVYSTCALSPEENEIVLGDVVRKFKGAVEIETTGEIPILAPAIGVWEGKVMDEAVMRARRIWPSLENEGFFVSRLRKFSATG